MIRRLALAVSLLAPPATAQDGDLHVLVVSGLSGEPSFAASLQAAATALVEAAEGPWGVPADRIAWLAEDPARDPARIDGRATSAALDAAFRRLARESREGDVVAVFLIGHGSGSGAESRISLPGPDPTAAEFARWLDALPGRAVVVVVAASASGDFLPVLARPGRVVITATRSATERNESLFASRFAHGLAAREADADKDGQVSVLEAFRYAAREVALAYERDGRLMTEHAQLDDTGDGRGVADPGAAGVADGALARRIAFGARPSPSDPRIAALLAERRGLEEQVEALRRRKDTLAEAAYLDQLERLLVAIAERTERIRRLGPGEAP